ncbi:acyltransferase family protein [Massilia yuzhufengensis]|uniref:Peptidoglycan/LPS O-acetylase OafA/YrhL, contains acyltransferase and SGNH-hydrolase domains n=1 Tax=Massilia yuzhufengensis TaxID=1164594 RepID=A0A1I1KPD9_9BURK|nr:acyltransferase [Massilia yuzhufengensis]SFC60528.1 Peptidoglycan/LPS O-acetylase OafA/YrhL, contains acyltransferase and SGNH-hydrolase domains [Massilia yuzhufengensis]
MQAAHHPGRVPGLDLLRAIAILWVMAYHVTSYGVKLPAIAEVGWMGVDLFFVLSGYLIGGQVFAQCASAEGPRWKDFMLRRALRVLPAYLAVLALYLWVPGWRESAGMQPAWQFLSFTANIFPDYFNNRAFSHVWSLCVEEHFYLLLPLAVTLLAWRPAAWKPVALVLAILVGGVLARALAWQLEVAPNLHISGGRDDWVLRFVEHIYNPTWARFDGLLAGVVLAALRQFRPGWWAWMTARAALFLATGLAITASTTLLLFVGPPRLATALAGYPLVALGLACILLAFASPQSPPGRLRIPGARLLATLAFSLYLTHKSAYHLVRTHGEWSAGGPAALVAYAGAALLIGALLHLAVERPGLQLRARLSRPRRALRLEAA